jgi:hypothetical protein
LKELAKGRSRSSWNDRLAYWERPASDSEEVQIERAASMVRDALSGSTWLTDEGVTIAPQGSYFNNTNVRQTADQDLRAMHPLIRVEHDNSLNWQTATGYLGTYNTGRGFADVAGRMRTEINLALGSKFGILNLDMSGTKATRVVALPGSRAPVDVAACFRYVWVTANGLDGIAHAEGVSILSTTGTWTNNFPVQHNQNGIAKRTRTQHRFKKVVRSLKCLRDEMVELKIIGQKQAPSFLIECLVYAVEDWYFTVTAADERYDRVLQVVERIDALLADVQWVQNAIEINHIKFLFRPQQPWTLEGARGFIQAANARLLGI